MRNQRSREGMDTGHGHTDGGKRPPAKTVREAWGSRDIERPRARHDALWERLSPTTRCVDGRHEDEEHLLLLHVGTRVGVVVPHDE